jgi:L-asparaginase
MVPQDPSNPASPLVPGDKEQILKYVPGLGEKHGIYWEIAGLPGEQPLDSSDVGARHWIKMAEVIHEKYYDWDGFVVLHGTDTMAYTTSGLAFMFRHLAKPVVFTGSQLPIADERTDARLNLANALQIAGYKATGLPLIPEVVLCFGNTLLRGVRARKDSTSDLNGFESPNCLPLGVLGESIDINRSLLRPVPDSTREKFSIDTRLETRVIDISLTPILGSEQLESVLKSAKVRGVVMRTFGAGNAMNDPSSFGALRSAIESNKTILNITQCRKGMVHMGLYAASSALLEMGVISGLDMTPEAALAKLCWLLGSELEDPAEVQRQLQINQRGEQSESLFDLRFGGKSAPKDARSVHKAHAEPSGQYDKERLKKAVLRISGLHVLAPDALVDICVYVNFPEATPETDPMDKHCAARFHGCYGAGETLLADVTNTVNQFTERGRRIHLTVISRTGAGCWYEGLSLALFTFA